MKKTVIIALKVFGYSFMALIGIVLAVGIVVTFQKGGIPAVFHGIFGFKNMIVNLIVSSPGLIALYFATYLENKPIEVKPTVQHEINQLKHLSKPL